LHPAGVFRATWFLCEKRFFPMMQDYQNALYINLEDPTNAVIYDRDFVAALYRAAGLAIVQVVPPDVRGFQWAVYATRDADAVPVAFPEDTAPFQRMVPPA
ncbi:MAG: hypothetical protein AB7P02_06740, partial [Alphaproteobacteria bacterium]